MSIGRPLQFEPEQALDAAMRIFWRKGYEATSLQDLLQATGLSKSSLYQTFGSKHTLFELCMEHYRQTLVGTMQEMLSQAKSGRDFIEQFFWAVSNETLGHDAQCGCLIMNAATEFSQSDPVIAQQVKLGIAAFRKVFEAAIIQAIEERDIPPDRDAKVLAAYLLTSMSGLKTQAKAGTPANELEAITDVILSALD